MKDYFAELKTVGQRKQNFLTDIVLMLIMVLNQHKITFVLTFTHTDRMYTSNRVTATVSMKS